MERRKVSALWVANRLTQSGPFVFGLAELLRSSHLISLLLRENVFFFAFCAIPTVMIPNAPLNRISKGKKEGREERRGGEMEGGRKVGKREGRKEGMRKRGRGKREERKWKILCAGVLCAKYLS